MRRRARKWYGHSGHAPLVPGRYYVLDKFDPAYRVGPFNTKREAEREVKSSNIAGDLVVRKAKG